MEGSIPKEDLRSILTLEQNEALLHPRLILTRGKSKC